MAKAFKDKEFRKLFMEYAEEISDPENRRVSFRTRKLLRLLTHAI